MLNCVISLYCAVHPRHPQVIRISAGEYSSSHQCRSYWHICQLRNAIQLVAVFQTIIYTAADNHHRFFCIFQILRYFQHLFLIHLARLIFQHHTIAHAAIVICYLYILYKHILGNINHNRTRTACAGYIERLCYNIWQLRCIRHRISVLANGLANTCHVCFLKSVLPQKFFHNLTHNAYHRNRIHIRCCNSCYQIGRTRS